jgi:hypothetical protein
VVPQGSHWATLADAKFEALPKYEFEKLATWVAAQPWAKSPRGGALSKRYLGLSAMMGWVDGELRGATRTEPLLFKIDPRAPAPLGKVWMEDRQLVMELAKQTRITQLRSLSPKLVIALASAVNSKPNIPDAERAHHARWIRMFREELLPLRAKPD